MASVKPSGSTQNSHPITPIGNHQLTNLPSSSGSANDTNLRVNIPSLQSAAQSFSAASTDSQLANVNRPSYAQAACKPPVVGSKPIGQSSIKASTKPREFHIHLGNLDFGTTSDTIISYIRDSGVIRELDCEIIQSKRVDKLKCVSAHVTIDARDRDKGFDAANWP